MKHKAAHGLTLLLIAVLVILTIATSAPDDGTNYGTVSFENKNDSFFIKVKTISDPSEYELYSDGFTLVFQGRVEYQWFSGFPDGNGQYRIRVMGKADTALGQVNAVVEELFLDEPGFRILTEKGLFIIQIDEELIKFANCFAREIRLFHTSSGNLESYFR